MHVGHRRPCTQNTQTHEINFKKKLSKTWEKNNIKYIKEKLLSVNITKCGFWILFWSLLLKLDKNFGS